MKQNEQQTFTLEAAAQEIGMSRCHLSKLVERGVLPSHATGALRLIDARDLKIFELRREIDRTELQECFAHHDEHQRVLDEEIADML